MDHGPPIKHGSKHRSTSAGRKEDSTEQQRGFIGLYVRLLRRYKTFFHILTLIPFYAVACLCLGLALVPGIALFAGFSPEATLEPTLLRYSIIGVMFAISYLLYGISLVLIIPLANKILVGSLKPCRGYYHSSFAVKWYIHNGLTYIVRYTFLEFITPTPINIFFYQLMGMKVGRNIQLNTSHISDPSLIELGSSVTVGGSAVIICHYGMSGYLVLAPVKIGDGVTIGMRAIVMGAVEIGAGAKVLPNSVVLPKTKIPAGEIWGGIPAKKIELEDRNKEESDLNTNQKLEESPAIH